MESYVSSNSELELQRAKLLRQAIYMHSNMLAKTVDVMYVLTYISVHACWRLLEYGIIMVSYNHAVNR